MKPTGKPIIDQPIEENLRQAYSLDGPVAPMPPDLADLVARLAAVHAQARAAAEEGDQPSDD